MTSLSPRTWLGALGRNWPHLQGGGRRGRGARAAIGKLLAFLREKPAGALRCPRGKMPSKTLRKAAPPNGAPDRRGHRARLALPGPSVTGATHLTSSHSSLAIHDPRGEDQNFRTSLRLPSYSESEAVIESALQLCKIGDKLNLRQRILNLIAKLFCPGTQECLE